jgi:predicted nucleic acid-binding protein
MILVDTNVLVALVCPKDALHERAAADLERLARLPLFPPTAVVSEACFLLSPEQRRRLDVLITKLPILPLTHESAAEEAEVRKQVFTWLGKYEDADFCDGYLAVLSSRERRSKVWSYDGEFTKGIWRRLNGTPIPMAAK